MTEEEFRSGKGIDHAPLSGIAVLCRDVKRFHKAFGHPIADAPRLEPTGLQYARSKRLESELFALSQAKTIADQSLAYMNIIHFAIGGLVVTGIEPTKLWDIVQGARMTEFPAVIAEIDRQIEAADAADLFQTERHEKTPIGGCEGMDC